MLQGISTRIFMRHSSVFAHFFRKVVTHAQPFQIHKQLNRFIASTSNMDPSSSSEGSIVAVCQLTSTSDREKNFRICKSLIERAKACGAQMVFLPECFDHVGESKEQSIQLAETLDGALMSEYKKLAQSHSVWLSLGGFHEKGPELDVKRIYNSHVIIDSKGQITSVYRKIHLFDIDIPGGVRLRESDYTIPGNYIMGPVDTAVGKIGLGICYDLRFPEFSLSMTKAGAEILTYPSAFTQTTGMAHWEPLLRTRAIESQCYVIAAAQTGKHNPKRVSYGHAMIVDPWGCVIACCREGIGIAVAEINLNYVHKVRKEMPLWAHRRPELYGSIATAQHKTGFDSSYKFGQVNLSASQLFYKTQYSIAFVNKKPVVPGHVLVAPIRCVERFGELSTVEIADLFACVQHIQKIIEMQHNASASTISVQDGADAGQSISHVHVHVLPRKPGDFKRNDDIYYELESHDKIPSRKSRTEEDMAAEALSLRKCFSS